MNKIDWPSDEEFVKLILKYRSYSYIAKIFACSPETVRNRAQRRNIHVKLRKPFSYEVKENIFLNENAISFYLLGAYFSDGNVDSSSNRISIVSKDEEWIIKIKNLISKNSPITKKNNAYIFRFSNRKIRDWLIKYNCVPKKSLICEMPNNIPLIYLRDFIRGVFDGDGSVSFKLRKKNNVDLIHYAIGYICSASNAFITSISKTLLQQNINNHLYCYKPRHSILKDGRIISPTAPEYKLTFQCYNLYCFLKYIYADCELFLKRKRDIALNIFEYYEKLNRRK